MSLKKAAIMGLSLCLSSMLGSLNADEIALPIQQQSNLTYSLSQEEILHQELSDWVFVKDNITGDIRQAFGSAIKFPEYGNATEENVEKIAEKFFQLYGKQFKVDRNNIRLSSKHYANNRWHLRYKQYYNDMEVLLSDITVTIFKNGNVMSAGAEYYDDIQISTTPKISYTQAISNASEGIRKQRVKDVVLSKPKMKILPYVVGSAVNYRLVYEHQYVTDEYNEKYTSYVDANEGEVLWRFGDVLEAQKKVSVRGEVTEKYAHDEPTFKSLPNMTVSTVMSTYYTDKNGEIDTEFDADKANIYLMGKYVMVYNKLEEISRQEIDLTEDQIDFEWNDQNSTFYERSLYYHTNVVHQYFKDIDSEQTFADFPVQVYLQAGHDGPNAASGGEQIYFINVDNPEAEMAGSGSVLYHEYGHSMNAFMYKELGSVNGMINTACNEALADITSCAILDDPKVGVGVFANDRERYIRNVDNNNRYPDDVAADPHHTGQILAGALWDLYKLTDMETLNNVSHYARYYTPDDANDGNSFAEWFIACIQADDDDGDLGNGTPHMQEIITSFNKHNIGVNILATNSFSHEPQVFYSENAENYQVDCFIDIEADLMFLKDFMSIESVDVVWSDWKGGESFTIPAQEIGGKFVAEIPKQSAGKVLRYYFNINISNAEEPIRLVSDKAYEDYDLAFIGYETKFVDDFEEDKGWVIGSDDDDATQGMWERETPKSVKIGTYELQPDGDHTVGGSKCLVTGSQGGIFLYSYVNGTSTVTSPIITLEDSKNPILEFAVWNIIAQFSQEQKEVSSEILMSTDAGQNWIKIKNIESGEGSWDIQYIQLNEFVPNLNGDIQFKIVANGYNGDMNDIALLEMLVDDFRIIDVKPGVSVAESKEMQFELYPNPADKNLTIKSDSPIKNIEIVDMLGNKVFQSNNLETMSFNWNISDVRNSKVNPGIYFVRISTAEGIRVEKVIVK